MLICDVIKMEITEPLLRQQNGRVRFVDPENIYILMGFILLNSHQFSSRETTSLEKLNRCNHCQIRFSCYILHLWFRSNLLRERAGNLLELA